MDINKVVRKNKTQQYTDSDYYKRRYEDLLRVVDDYEKLASDAEKAIVNMKYIFFFTLAFLPFGIVKVIDLIDIYLF